ncbi:MAG: outer membrane lipoprotein carrier protein LolA [Rhodospirillales bacterium]
MRLLLHHRIGFLTAKLFVLAAILLVPISAGAVISSSLKLIDADRADMARVEDYLNSIKTIRSRFLQISSSGDYSEGRLFLSRPGHMRIEYLPPKPLMVVVADGYLTYIDTELDHATVIPLNLTPAEMLVRETISFGSDEIIITDFDRSPGVLRLNLAKADDLLEGNMTLVFSDRPLELRKWIVADGQGEVTTVSLLGPEFDVPIDPQLFDYELPEAANLK